MMKMTVLNGVLAAALGAMALPALAGNDDRFLPPGALLVCGSTYLKRVVRVTWMPSG